MTATDTETVRVVGHFSQTAERVFDAWLDPRAAGRWLFNTPTGQMVRVEIDPRVGGRFAIVERRDGQDVDHVGEYFEIVRPARLVFSFSVPKFSTQSTRVAIDILPQAGGCQLTLTHEGVLREWADRTREGWGKILGKLAHHLGESG